MRNGFLAGCLVALVLALAGCGESEPRRYEVHGKITWEDKTIPEGDIFFVPENPELRTEAGKIKDGVYRFKANPGKNKVEVWATRPVPGKKDPMGKQLKEGYIPDQYNKTSTLTAEVAPGKTTFDFSLKPD